MSEVNEVRIAESREEENVMESQGLCGMLEKVPDLWTIASCFQRLNCLNQRGECPVEPKDEIRNRAYEEESLTESEEDGSGCEPKSEDEHVQQPDFDLLPPQKVEPKDKRLMVKHVMLLAGVNAALFVFLAEYFEDLGREQDTIAELLAGARKCVTEITLLPYTVITMVLIICFHKREIKIIEGENHAESQEDEDDQQVDREASPKSLWTRATEIVMILTLPVFVGGCVLYFLHHYDEHNRGHNAEAYIWKYIESVPFVITHFPLTLLTIFVGIAISFFHMLLTCHETEEKK